MFFNLVPYLLLVLIAAIAAGLFTSKSIAEKFVAAGFFPRTFLGILPFLQVAIRIFGFILIIVGLTKIALDSGWLNHVWLSRYAISIALLVLGLILLLLSHRENK